MRLFKNGNRKFRPVKFHVYLMIGIMGIFTFACSTPKNITYFKDVPDTIKRKVVEDSKYSIPTIQPDDVLQVNIQTLDPSTTTLLNQANTTTIWPGANNAASGAPAAQNISGYLVDGDGYVLLPLLGKVYAKGKTTSQVRDDIQAKAAAFYKDPVVTVRFTNFKVTVLGEVTRPSSYIMQSEKVSLLDAIGMAGDLTIYGKRENVLLIREGDKKKEFIRFNLNDSKIFQSEYFYLKQGDIVYIEPNKSKVNSTDASRLRNITIAGSALSVLIVLISRINF